MKKQGLLYRLRRNLADIIDPDRATPAAAPGIEPHAAAAPTPKASTAGFEEQLKALLQRTGRKTLASGRINIIGLGKIKERFGAEWERVAARVDRLTRHTIERHMVQGDIFGSLQGGLAYVLVFAQLATDQARIKCALIGAEIGRVLLGEEGAELLEVKTAVAEVDGSFHLREVRLEEEVAKLAEPPADLLEFAEEEDDKDEAREEARPAEPVVRESPRDDPLANLRFLYRPIWDQTRNVVSAYLCVTQAASGDGSSLWWDGAVVTQGKAEERARLDEMVLNHTLDDLDELLRDKRSLMLVLPLHFESLAAVARRRRYAQLLQERLSDAARQLLLIEIEGTPDGVPQPRLLELTLPLRPHCRGIMLRLAPETSDFTNLRGTGVVSAGCDIAYHPGPEFLLMQHLNRFARTATEKAGVTTYVLGAHSMSLVAAALGAGFNSIAGDAVGKAINHPRGLVEFSLSDLYSRVASS